MPEFTGGGSGVGGPITSVDLGLSGDAAWSGTGSGTLIGIAKAICARLGGVVVTADKNGAAFSSATVMVAGGGPVAAGRSVEILCSVDGTVSFAMAGGGNHAISIAASPYTQTFPYSVTGINVSGTTATATYANLN